MVFILSAVLFFFFLVFWQVAAKFGLQQPKLFGLKRLRNVRTSIDEDSTVHLIRNHLRVLTAFVFSGQQGLALGARAFVYSGFVCFSLHSLFVDAQLGLFQGCDSSTVLFLRHKYWFFEASEITDPASLQAIFHEVRFILFALCGFNTHHHHHHHRLIAA